ncbi:MAG: hypothetical protein KAW92_10575 [Candidatus Cloacimonetes bacterium]|nr:hypothetical protein [Candidatus Cloacimonadota bacterium]
MKVIYIGEFYYWKSKTAMSSVYQIDESNTFKRTNWGLIQVALQRGEEVHIRPANEKELKQMDKHLKALQ